MSDLPTLDTFDIIPPVFIRKINSRNRWIQYSSEEEEDRDKKIANDVFNAEKCSLWWVNSDEDFYGFVASISANRSPQNQNIDFILIPKEDLDELNIKYEQISEGDCLAVKHLHYDALIKEEQAILICRKHLNIDRQPQRCNKRQTQAILEHQKQKGCVAVTKNPQSCQNYSCC
jgi:hypothetical protein